jgi:TonB family protein
MTVDDPTQIDVEVHIDKRGRVLDAHAINETQENSLLASAAIRAAKHWTFEPAERGGKNVPSKHIIAFNFIP